MTVGISFHSAENLLYGRKNSCRAGIFNRTLSNDEEKLTK
jgi:hypothetical protein